MHSGLFHLSYPAGRGGVGWGGGDTLNMHSLQAGVNKKLPASLKYLQAFSSQ